MTTGGCYYIYGVASARGNYLTTVALWFADTLNCRQSIRRKLALDNRYHCDYLLMCSPRIEWPRVGLSRFYLGAREGWVTGGQLPLASPPSPIFWAEKCIYFPSPLYCIKTIRTISRGGLKINMLKLDFWPWPPVEKWFSCAWFDRRSATLPTSVCIHSVFALVCVPGVMCCGLVRNELHKNVILCEVEWSCVTNGARMDGRRRRFGSAWLCCIRWSQW